MAIFRRKGVNLPRTDFAALFLLSAALALLLAGNSRESLLAAQGQFAGKEAVLSGTVSSVVRREDGGSSFLLKNASVTADDGTEGNTRSSVSLFYADGELSFDGGERVRLRAELSDELTLSQIGMGAELTAFRPEYLGEEGAAFWHPLYALRNDFLTWAQARGLRRDAPGERERYAGDAAGQPGTAGKRCPMPFCRVPASSTSSRCRGCTSPFSSPLPS